MKRQFQVGDTVESIFTGVAFSVVEVGQSETMKVKGQDSWLDQNGFRLVKPAWTPQPGEMILVFGDNGHKLRREFFAMDGNLFVVRSVCPNNTFLSWKYAEPLPQTHTITFADKTTLEISQEQYAALRAGQ